VQWPGTGAREWPCSGAAEGGRERGAGKDEVSHGVVSFRYPGTVAGNLLDTRGTRDPDTLDAARRSRDAVPRGRADAGASVAARRRDVA